MVLYKIIFKNSVEKDIRKVDKSQIPKLLETIQSLAKFPYPNSSRQLVGSEKTYRIRVGDYRIVYFVDSELSEIIIQRVAHRKDVYK